MGFNPVLGFLSVSTVDGEIVRIPTLEFQSRAGFSECLDDLKSRIIRRNYMFQSRAGFSECLDTQKAAGRDRGLCVSIPCWVF